ncbi:DUF5808 domain-containing protein [Paraflavitalea speifideaquila]|uniref:DUF5808 domain-containing protein n=1 Tax=Paraflavitalea speifideaquila TaxID=3076558 RepID=UPI0028E73400|nr:DUF5808 domain-containing protein [Paraflavitalea speifideiaquila]
MKDPIDDNTHYVWNAFYFNKEDSRILVSKRVRGMGFTFNFAQPATWFILLGALACIFLLSRTA